MDSSSGVQYVSSPILTWIESKIKKAEEDGDAATLSNYRDMYNVWKRRIIEVDNNGKARD